MPSFRTILIFGSLVLGAILHTKFGLGGGALIFYINALWLTVIHFILGHVWSAYNAMKKGDTTKAGKIINQTTFPQLLIPRNRAYYYFVKGMLHLQQKDLNLAKVDLNQAVSIGLYRPNDQALALLNVAHIHFVQKNTEESRRYMLQAQEIEHNDLMIKEHLSKLQTSLQAR